MPTAFAFVGTAARTLTATTHQWWRRLDAYRGLRTEHPAHPQRSRAPRAPRHPRGHVTAVRDHGPPPRH